MSKDMIKTGNDHVDSFIMIKTYARATYSIDQAGHFGLGLSEYLHFTSPMRRYADVLVHRILAGVTYAPSDLEREVDWINCQATKNRALQTLYKKWKIQRYASLTFQTIWITGVNRGGVMWFLPALSMSGYAHISTIEPKRRWIYHVSHWSHGELYLRVGQSYSAMMNGEHAQIYVS